MRVTKLGQPASRLDEHWDIPQHLECQLGKGPGWHAHPPPMGEISGCRFGG